MTTKKPAKSKKKREWKGWAVVPLGFAFSDSWIPLETAPLQCNTLDGNTGSTEGGVRWNRNMER